MSAAVGVAVAAASIELMQLVFGDGALVSRDMTWSFAIVALVTLCSVPMFTRLEADAGAEVREIGRRASRPARRPSRPARCDLSARAPA